MSQALHHAQLRVLNSQQSLPTVAQVFVLFAVVVTKWDIRRRSRKSLRYVDDHTLFDIGVTRDDARKEAHKPFWRD